MSFTNSMVVIHCDRTVTRIRVSDDGTNLVELQSAVGGYIEAIGLRSDLIMYVNEEGGLKDLPYNPAAQGLLQTLGVQVRTMGLMLQGDVVLVGNDGGPETVGVPDDIYDALKSLWGETSGS